MTDEEWEQIVMECEANALPDSEIDTSDIPEIDDDDGWYFGNPEHIPVRVVHTSPTTAYIERLDGKDDIPLVSFKREAMKQAVANH